MLVFTGNAHPALAQEICLHLGQGLGNALVSTFRNEETRVRVEENVRGADVFVIQSTCSPVDHNIMELLLMIDALRRASAHRVTAVIPYYGYAKQEKKTAGREPISAKLVANLIRTAGADRVVTMDLHAAAIEGFFDMPVDHLRANPLMAGAIRRRLPDDEIVIVSPDSGGVSRANDFRLRVGGHLAIIAKQRPQPDQAEVIEMVGDVRGKTAVIVDDMISTGGTLIEAAETLLERGAREVIACATHGIFAGNAVDLIQDSRIKEVVVTNTIPLRDGARRDKIDQVSVAPLLAEAIRRIHRHESVSALFT
ncbi:MAG TPA: ribose-phosphate pyrophosphokinase [Chloroflexota bacterium]|nr:ribose-phosphate pyrophosphokinase [Chloroflexota bacterium]